jgi:hypothetical protein
MASPMIISRWPVHATSKLPVFASQALTDLSTPADTSHEFFGCHASCVTPASCWHATRGVVWFPLSYMKALPSSLRVAQKRMRLVRWWLRPRCHGVAVIFPPHRGERVAAKDREQNEWLCSRQAGRHEKAQGEALRARFAPGPLGIVDT